MCRRDTGGQERGRSRLEVRKMLIAGTAVMVPEGKATCGR